MTLYARSDVTSASGIPGGCGIQGGHSRPVVNGAPVKIFQLDCPPCEDWLRVHMSDQWSTNPVEIPETYDEKAVREKAEKSGKLDRERQLADALTALSELGRLPEAIAQAFGQALTGAPAPAAVAGMLECSFGHATQAPARFCAQCGEALSQPAPAAAIPGPQQAAEPPSPPTADVSVPRMRDGRVDVLKAFAAASGLDDSGKRADLISRLSNAGLTGKWADFAAPYYAAAVAA